MISPPRRARWAPLALFCLAATVHAEEPAAGRRVVTITTPSAQARQAFLQGRDFIEDSLADQALASFHQAVVHDPNFPMALAYLGGFNGAEGRQNLQRAVTLAATLPMPERHFVELLVAKGQNERARADELVRQLMQEVPDDWRPVFQFGELAFQRHDWERAISAYRRALVMSDEPNRRCQPFNNLGYAEALVGHYDKAVAALQRCVALQPQAPNPQDTLGDIELAAGALNDADASFHRAVTISPSYWWGWHGIAVVDFAHGQWDQGDAALARGRSAALPMFRLYFDSLRAWALFTRGKSAKALQVVDSMEAVAQAAKGPGQYYFALAPLVRASLLNELGRYPQGLAAANLCLKRLNGSGLAGAIADSLRRRALRRKLWAEAKLGAPAMDQTLAALEAEAKAQPEDPELAGSAQLARGAVQLAHGKAAEAAASWAQCHLDGLTEWSVEGRLRPEGNEFCVWQLAQLEERLGNHAEATRTRALLANRFSRDPQTLYIRTRVVGASAAQR